MKEEKYHALKSLFSLLSIVTAFGAPSLFGESLPTRAEETNGPVRALMITGGGWHDYHVQRTILSDGIRARANVEWTIIIEGMEGDTQERSRHIVGLLQEPGWEKDFDVVVYNICFSNVTDVDFVEGIAKVHEEGLAAVVLHCAVHSFRHAETDAWRKLLGIDSIRHEQHRAFLVENLAPEHPVMKGFGETWQTPKGELYVIEDIRARTTPLARAYGVDTEEHHVTVWTNQYGDGRVFGTTIGHHNETMEAGEYLDLVTRGLLWTVGKLEEDGTPAAGFAAVEEPKKRLVLVAGPPSHAKGMHEHEAGVRLLKNCLQNVPGLEVVAHYNGWPDAPDAFEAADGILLYMDGGGRHPAIQDDRLQELGRLMGEGVGLAVFHYAVEVPKDRGGVEFLEWVGGYYETHFSINPIWTAEFTAIPEHPIARGVEPFSARDEWYFNIRFRPGMEGVKPILQAMPSDETRDGPYVSPRGPYPHIVEAKGNIETVAWAVERADGGRGFGFTGAHFHENWGNDNFRKVALNALVWIAGAEVPPNGVECNVTAAQLEEF